MRHEKPKPVTSGGLRLADPGVAVSKVMPLAGLLTIPQTRFKPATLPGIRGRTNVRPNSRSSHLLVNNDRGLHEWVD